MEASTILAKEADLSAKQAMEQCDHLAKEVHMFLQNRLETIEEKSASNEHYARRNNLILDGLPETKTDHPSLVKKVRDVFSEFGVPKANDIHFDRIQRLPFL